MESTRITAVVLDPDTDELVKFVGVDEDDLDAQIADYYGAPKSRFAICSPARTDLVLCRR